MLRLAPLFYRGAYQELLTGTLETAGARWERDETCYVVGALAFVGRIDDALVLYARDGGGLTGKSRAAARFFLGIGLVRVSRYAEGLRWLVENLRDLRAGALGTDAAARFYVHQGVAFHRYFQMRFERALASAKAAWAAALEADYAYGQALASDLRGHAMVRSGLIAAGLKALDDSARLCERFGLHAQGNVVRTAQFYYRANHGLFGDDTVPELERFVRSFAPEDNFTQAVAQCELARQLAIRGRVSEAERYLEEAARVILKAGHRRHKMMVMHLFAHNRYYMGRFDEAREYLDKAAAEADEVSRLEIEGLRLKIARRLGEPRDELEATVLRLTLRGGAGIARNVLWRETGLGKPTLTGDDVLGDLRHKCRHGSATSYSDVLAILRSGHLGFLHEVVPEARASRLVCFDLLPKRVAVFADGDVVMKDEPVSSMMKAVALQFARAPCTKRELIETVWGYAYHSLRHDPLVYAVINRLRHALGPASAWLRHDGTTYGWAPEARVLTYEPQGIEGSVAGPLEDERPDRHAQPASRASGPLSRANPTADPSLNHRQLAILAELARREFLSAKACVELFGVSRITAARDLGDLYRRGLLTRHGRGRATHYALLAASGERART